MEWLWPAVLILLIAALLVVRRSRRPRLRCPNCGSDRAGLTAKEPLGMQESSWGAGGPGGGFTSLQLRYRLQYQCDRCRHRWAETVTETA